jgi:tRNA pseudouridine32 synthase/23S rRNA pseudouridine746 synthase
LSTDLNILHEDRSLLVINKQCGLLSVPGRGEEKQDCVVSRAKELYPDLPSQPAVHRLDMMTSGLMLLARTPQAHRNLVRQFQYRLVLKRYVAIVEGDLLEESGTIELAFRLDPENRPLQIYDPVNGKQGVTLWRKIAREPSGTRVEFTPLTGRTHQLRLHASHPMGLGSPIVGDYLYGSGNDGDRMLLHSCFISFNHPENNNPCTYSSEPPF